MAPLKTTHLLRCPQNPNLHVPSKVRSGRDFSGRLAPGQFLEVPKTFFLIFVFFLTCCNFEADVLSSATIPSSGVSTTPSETAGTSLYSLAINRGSAIQLTEGQSKMIYLDVSLSDGSVYRGITKTFNTSHDDLDAPVIWYSNDEKIATVSSSGKITAVAEGNTFIQANLGNKSVQIQVSVTATKIEMARMTFFKSTLVSSHGEAGLLTLNLYYSNGASLENVSPTQFRMIESCDLNFSSSNEDVAVVYQSGVFSPLQNGSAVFTANCGNFSAQADLEVSGLDVPATETEINDVIESVTIVLDASEFEIGEEKTLICDLSFDTGDVSGANNSFVLPTGGIGNIEWQSSDKEVVSIVEDEDHVIKARFESYGEATLTATYSDLSDEVLLQSKMISENAANSDDYFINSDDDLYEDFSADGGYGLSSFPEIVYGLPEDSLLDVVSFGTRGELIIKFNGYVIVDGIGNDFTVFENPFDDWFEAAKISVSEDGSTYHEFPCDAFGSGEGCAGVSVVNYSSNSDDMRNPEISGGDSFDLADVGLERAVYVKIVDAGTCVEDGYLCTSDTIGFDLDAMAIVNGVNE